MVVVAVLVVVTMDMILGATSTLNNRYTFRLVIYVIGRNTVFNFQRRTNYYHLCNGLFSVESDLGRSFMEYTCINRIVQECQKCGRFLRGGCLSAAPQHRLNCNKKCPYRLRTAYFTDSCAVSINSLFPPSAIPPLLLVGWSWLNLGYSCDQSK